MGVSKFGSYLKEQRKARGLTLSKAAELIGISTSRLAEIERGTSYHTDHATRPSRELVEKIAKAFDLPRDMLLIEAGHPVDAVSELSPEARRLLLLFETLSPERKRLALGMLRLLAEPD
jgi:transcriptional regulator with XRE-family HTH domain